MKKYLSIFIITITLLTLCACSSNVSTVSANKTTQNVTTTQDRIDDTETQDINEIDSSEETVLIRYFRQRKELSYNDEMKNILNDIKECEDKPKTEFVNKIGSISIRHNNDDGSEDFANIYIGEDDNIYARYINNDDDKTAYKLDIELFGLE